MNPPEQTMMTENRLKCICPHSDWIIGSHSLRVLQCATAECHTVEHYHCMLPNGQQKWPVEEHRCVKCRMAFADPFWHSVKPTELLQPTIIPPIAHSNQQYPATSNFETFKGLDRSFSLSAVDIANIRAKRQKVQVVCLQLEDEVQFRYHWPKHCTLKVNNRMYRVYGRHAENAITKGQRDEPASLEGALVQTGTNRFQLSCYDNQRYVVCVQIVAETSKEAVYGMMHIPEKLDAAVMRMSRIVRSQVSCNMDDEIKTTTSTMSLKCTFSSKRIKVPGRLLNIDSLDCVFDLDDFLTMVKKTRKWACPHTLKSSSIHHLAKDVWLEAVLKCLQPFPEVLEIEVSIRGDWRIRGESRWRNVYNTNPIDQLPAVLKQPFLNGCEIEDDDESEDELEELKKAALAAKQEINRHHQVNKTMTTEVIDLLSSDEEDESETILNQAPSLHSPPIRHGGPHTVQLISGPRPQQDKELYTLVQNSNRRQVDFTRQFGSLHFPGGSVQPYPVCEYRPTPYIIQPAYNAAVGVPNGQANAHHFSPSNTLDVTSHPTVSELQGKRDRQLTLTTSRCQRKRTRSSKYGGSGALNPQFELIEIDQTDSN